MCLALERMSEKLMKRERDESDNDELGGWKFRASAQHDHHRASELNISSSSSSNTRNNNNNRSN